MANSFTLDGVSDNIEFTGFRGGAGVAYTPQVDAIAEFMVATDNYSRMVKESHLYEI